MIIIITGEQFLRKKVHLCLLDIVVPCVFAAGVCLCLLMIGITIRQTFPFRFESLSQKGWHVVPDRTIATVCFLYDIESWDRELPRHILHGLLKKKYEVYITGVDSGYIGFENARFLFQKANQHKSKLPIFLLGTDNGGRHALLVASEKKSTLTGVITLDSPVRWPFENLSPILQASSLNYPVLLIASEKNSSVARELEEYKELHHATTISFLTNRPEKKYQEVVQLADDFIKNHLE